MNDALRWRLHALAQRVQKEMALLQGTDTRLFTTPLSPEQLNQLDQAPELADRIEAYASRFARLQDTVGDKLIPAWLQALEETPGAAIDNLNRAERLGVLPSVDEWLNLRQMRNMIVHEYMDDPEQLASALQLAHEKLPLLLMTAQAILNDLRQRGLLTLSPQASLAP